MGCALGSLNDKLKALFSLTRSPLRFAPVLPGLFLSKTLPVYACHRPAATKFARARLAV